jgi:hypothetical protein
MALKQTLSELTANAMAVKNRVDILLEQLEDSEDLEVLQHALNDKRITGAALTRALRKEYGPAVVKDFSVDNWRRKNLSEITGL